ncbi:Gfo/Idh/MocA family protein [Phenylobacterium terrae]|uniref:Gfo/Idh/MocA family protein n=1 Tax=Phenylobacterium terrae TaxID=2665495 RepID=A0ABW4N7R6_9CAUL
MPVKLAIVGVGKIARDQHLPVIAASPDFELAAAASRSTGVEGVKSFTSLAELLDACPEVEAVSLCTPPVGRAQDARLAISRGVHVLLEKPPAATLSEVDDLARRAQAAGVTLFASWHSRFAPAVPAAKAWLQGRTVRAARITWKEDVRVWHPGQEWIFAPGGMGVFDPGVNALSIVTEILPETFALRRGRLVFPSNRQAPIAAELAFEDARGAPIAAELDFLHTGDQRWDIEVETDGGRLVLSKGGSEMTVDGTAATAGAHGPHAEYAPLYAHFARLIAERRSDVDVAPFRHVADAFMIGERVEGPAFAF